MLLGELKKYYGTFAEMSRSLGLGSTSYTRWKNRGFIPFGSQLLIEKKTNGLFKADENHVKKRKRRQSH